MRKAYKAETQSANGREKDGLAGRVRPRAAMALKRLSKDCVNLLESMLDPSEETRCTMHQVKEHPWFRRELPAELRRALTDLDTVQARTPHAQTRPEAPGGGVQSAARHHRPKETAREAKRFRGKAPLGRVECSG